MTRVMFFAFLEDENNGLPIIGEKVSAAPQQMWHSYRPFLVQHWASFMHPASWGPMVIVQGGGTMIASNFML